MSGDVTVRRNLEQIKHCVEEALSIVIHREDPRHALDDLEQARQLILSVRVRILEEKTARAR